MTPFELLKDAAVAADEDGIRGTLEIILEDDLIEGLIQWFDDPAHEDLVPLVVRHLVIYETDDGYFIDLMPLDEVERKN